MTQTLGLFEMLNPELLANETLSDQIKSKLHLPVFSISRSNLVELYSLHLSPKSQRIYRENRRGTLLKKRQKSSSKSAIPDIMKNSTQSTNLKRSSTTEVKSGVSDSKRSKITWP